MPEFVNDRNLKIKALPFNPFYWETGTTKNNFASQSFLYYLQIMQAFNGER